MQKVEKDVQQLVKGGGHYHWRCRVNGYVSQKMGSYSQAEYWAGVHAGTYNHGGNVYSYYCEC